MTKAIALNQPAPDFTLEDFEGRRFRLADLIGEKYIVLVLNRGFQ